LVWVGVGGMLVSVWVGESICVGSGVETTEIVSHAETPNMKIAAVKTTAILIPTDIPFILIR